MSYFIVYILSASEWFIFRLMALYKINVLSITMINFSFKYITRWFSCTYCKIQLKSSETIYVSQLSCFCERGQFESNNDSKYGSPVIMNTLSCIGYKLDTPYYTLTRLCILVYVSPCMDLLWKTYYILRCINKCTKCFMIFSTGKPKIPPVSQCNPV